jgi:3-hydroxy acid dehydrogenase / malonic semialdehyde reductase
VSAPLAGRTVLVTGASSGIGRALARELVAGGARVVAAARSVDKLRALADEVGANVMALRGDVTDAAAVQQLADAVGPVDVVVNNAGVGHVEPFLDSDPARWRLTLDTNLIGALLMARAFLPGMLAAARGLIVNVGSASATGWPYLTLYAASKAALQAASVALDREYAGRGVRVRYVEVGPTAGTDFGTQSDPAHLPTAARAWTELGIAWRTDLATPETSARAIRAAIERGLTSE